MKPTGCTLLLSIFISTSLHVSGNCVPIIRRTYCIYATLVFFTLYGWLAGLQSEKYQYRIDTVSSPDDGHIVARNMYRSWNKYSKKYCAPSWLHLKQIIQGCRSTKHKILRNTLCSQHRCSVAYYFPDKVQRFNLKSMKTKSYMRSISHSRPRIQTILV